jgi:G:T-mismatch repair DNA endonuclease (very short patch repair protein)
MPIVMCDHCGTVIEKPNSELKRTSHSFCSRECYYKFKRRDFDIEKAKDLYLNKHYSVRQVAKEIDIPSSRIFKRFKKEGILRTKSEATQYRDNLFKKKNIPWNIGKHHSTKTKEKISALMKDRPSWTKGKHLPEKTKDKISNAARKRWKDPEFAKKMFKAVHHKPTKIEKYLDGILQKYFPGEYKYVGCGDFVIYGLNPDFVNCNGKKKIIEVFGNAYHDPEKSYVDISWKQTDFGRVAIFSQLGYDTLIIWESELKNKSEEEIVEEIKKFHER